MTFHAMKYDFGFDMDGFFLSTKGDIFEGAAYGFPIGAVTRMKSADSCSLLVRFTNGKRQKPGPWTMLDIGY